MKLILARTLAVAVLLLAVGAPASAQYFNNKNNDESYKGNNYNRHDNRYKGNDDNYAGNGYTGDTKYGERFTVPGPGTLALLGIGVAGLGIGVAGLVIGLRRKK